jgi:hypothetical protein
MWKQINEDYILEKERQNLFNKEKPKRKESMKTADE